MLNKMNINVHQKMPSAQEYIDLRVLVGWDKVDIPLATTGLKNSLFHVTVRDESELIGMARVVGDGALFFYIQDVVVHPAYQKQGIGRLLMEQVEQYLAKHALQGATIGLLSAQCKEPFYQQYGYLKRTGSPLGFGMCKFV